MASIDVAVIGAGLLGLTLALSPQKQGIASTTYEARSTSLDIGGAIMPFPNALRVLEPVDMDVDKRIKPLELSLPISTSIPMSYSTHTNLEMVQGARRACGSSELIDALLAAIEEKKYNN